MSDTPKPTPRPRPNVEAVFKRPVQQEPKLEAKKTPRRAPVKKTSTRSEKPRVVKTQPRPKVKTAVKHEPKLREHLMYNPFASNEALSKLQSTMTETVSKENV